VAANLLSAGLKAGHVTESDLREVQRQRMWPTRVIQRIQTLAQKRVIAAALNPNQQFKLPLAARIFLHIPWLRDLPARVIAFGVRRVRLRPELLAEFEKTK
jgi:hypothetical protein